LCRIYGQRPKYCRQFECALLKRVKAGDVSPASALSLVRSARKRAATVLRLLRQMGETDESAPLAARFRRVSEKAEKSGLQGKPAAVFGKLTNAIQGLNHLLARTFYPGE
jgi:Fe-S-cluster containining protein